MFAHFANLFLISWKRLAILPWWLFQLDTVCIYIYVFMWFIIIYIYIDIYIYIHTYSWICQLKSTSCSLLLGSLLSSVECSFSSPRWVSAQHTVSALSWWQILAEGGNMRSMPGPHFVDSHNVLCLGWLRDIYLTVSMEHPPFQQ